MYFSVTANFGCVMPHHHQFNLYGTKTFIQNTDNAKIFFLERKIKFNNIKQKIYQ